MSLPIPAYRPRSTALHTAGAGVGALFCVALVLPAVLFSSPLVLVAVVGAVFAAALGSRVLGDVLRSARLGLPLALLVVAVNPLVANEGSTLLVRGYVVLGRRLDITLEEVAVGGVAGLRVLALVLGFALLSAAVDPDDLLRVFRRFSYRSALTAVLATRLAPVLARDASRRGEAARCHPRRPSRTALVRAALGGALDRSVEVAAALEVRGYAAAAPRRAVRRRRSRHDVRLGAAALGLAIVAIAARIAGVGAFTDYPELAVAAGTGEAALCAALVALAAAPFAGAAARLGVARA